MFMADDFVNEFKFWTNSQRFCQCLSLCSSWPNHKHLGSPRVLTQGNHFFLENLETWKSQGMQKWSGKCKEKCKKSGNLCSYGKISTINEIKPGINKKRLGASLKGRFTVAQYNRKVAATGVTSCWKLAQITDEKLKTRPTGLGGPVFHYSLPTGG